MRTSTVLIALAVALISLALAWLTAPTDPFARATAPTPETFALGFDTHSVNALTLTTPDQQAALTRHGSDWILTLPTTNNASTDWPANPEAARVLLTELATQAIEAAPDHNTSAAPLATLAIDHPTGPTTIDILAQPLAGRLPVRVTTPEQTRHAFVPAARFRPTDTGQLAALASPRPLDLPGVVTRITIAPRDAAPYTLTRDAGVWGYAPDDTTTPRDIRLDQDTARFLIDALRALPAASVVIPTNPNAAGDTPFLTVSLDAERPRAQGEPRRVTTATLAVSDRPSADGLSDALATHDNGATTNRLQIRLDPESFPALPADIGSLLDPTPLPWGPSGTAAATFQSATRTTAYTRTIDGWQPDPINASSNNTPPTNTDESRRALHTLLAALTRPATAVRLRDAASSPPDTSDETITATFTPAGSGDPITLTLHTATNTATAGPVEWTLDTDTARLTEALQALLNAPSN